jgi:hypothetical protein
LIATGSQLSAAAQFNVVLDPSGQGGEIASAAVTDNNDEPM